MPILRALALDGTYHSQFVTGTSNGGLTAHPGGDRWRWGSRIFGGVYDDAAAHERPVYGALNFRRQAVGAAPRFGSSHFRLNGAALARATFCYPDSAAEPTDFGVAAGMHLLALAEADEPGAPLEVPRCAVVRQRRHRGWSRSSPRPFGALPNRGARRPAGLGVAPPDAEGGHGDPRVIGGAAHRAPRLGMPAGAGTASYSAFRTVGGHTPAASTPSA
ncbi:DUF3626 domain-containing protein [Streptomyces sp. NPDC093591]|uniref:DUF3626 domain-containing protein n=1 Tax=Streptomyces sp. NPDC093591 TaxID=3366044 RepID=UPI00381F441C